MKPTRLVSLTIAASLLAACSSQNEGAGSSSALQPCAQNGPDGGEITLPAPTPVAPSDDLLGDATLSTAQPALKTVKHPVVPSALLASTAAPLPTHAFWENLALGEGKNRINAYPYQVRAAASGLGVSLPAVLTSAVGSSTPVVTDIALGASVDFTGHRIVARDDVSATIAFEAGAGKMTTPIVEGMAYVSAHYDKLIPVLSSEHAILTVNGGGAPATGTRFEVTMNDGKTWLVYTSSPVTFSLAGSKLVAAAAFDGDVRVAQVTGPDAAAVLDQHHTSIPLGGTVRAKVDGASAILEIEWKTADGSSPLMLALPHHAPRLATGMLGAPKLRTIRGEVGGVAAQRWSLRYDAPALGFTAPRAIAASRREAVAQALAADSSFVPDATVVSQDPYFGGKQLAKLARLVLVAEELGDTARADAMRARLAPLVQAWLDGTNGNPLVYETSWGGIVTTRGVADPGADFGQGWFNDHHFHYGYHVYAASVVAKGNPGWAAQNKEKVLALVRDIANPSSKDPYFPRLRHSDLFAGHSWANGLFDLGDGRNQESTSEAVNAWYAVGLFGQAFGEPRLRDLGRVLLAAEAASAQTYWQVPASSTVYAEPLASRRVVANLWSTKVDYGTFFGDKPEYIFGIQMLPITPATEQLLPATWIRDSWPALQSAAQSAEQGWGGILTMSHAVIDKDAAWAEMNRFTAYDDGNSRTNALYWIATRP
ncbi:MAG: uncharacterized protein JWP87_5160 [Labilithrix sp.]|nr:uncharacterized protein [Labilithrix sp.]